MTGRIERIEPWHVNVPLSEPFWPSWIPGYPQTHVAQTYARFVTSDGLTGETAGPAFTTERRGLGVQVDERLLRRYGKRFHVSTPTRVALHTIREKGLKSALALKKAKQAPGR
jgi:L-alanine-DL-glutamate epimerase-like enolase superfamily enzyme